MNNDRLMEELISVFQNFSELNSKHYSNNYDNLNMNEVHTIDFIGRTGEPNLKAITDGIGITKGAIAKITKRLEARGLISSYKREDNKKEKFFRLETDGIEVFEKHLELHKKAFDRDKKIFDRYNDSEKELLSKFLNDLNKDLYSKI